MTVYDRKDIRNNRNNRYKMKSIIFWKNLALSLFSFHRPVTTCQVSEKIMNRS